MEHILLKISIMLVPALLAVTLHEVAHGFSAEQIGTIALLVFGFGWARPVPVNTNNLRQPQKDMIWVSLAGPLANLMLALFCALLLRVVVYVSASLPEASQLVAFIRPIGLMAAFGLYINVILCLFNLLPIPPLDGGRVLMGVLPEKQAQMLRRVEPFGMLLIVFLIFGTSIWSAAFGPAVHHVVALMAGPHLDVVEQTMRLLFYR